MSSINVRNVQVSVWIPDELDSIEKLIYVRPGKEDQQLSFTRQKDRVSFELPELKVWGMVVFTSGLEHKTKNALSNLRKEVRRKNIQDLNIDQWLDKYNTLYEYYEGRNYDEALSGSKDLLEVVRQLPNK